MAKDLAWPLALSLPSRISQRVRTSLPSLFATTSNTQIEHRRVLGYDAVSCLVDLREIAAETVEAVAQIEAVRLRRRRCGIA